MFAKLIRYFSTLGLFVFIALNVAVARASIVFHPGVTYTTSKVSDQTGAVGDSDAHALTLDARLGTVFETNGLFLGGMYKLEDGGSTGTDLKGFMTGPSVGYAQNNLVFIFTYFLAGERKTTAGGIENKYSQGRGYQFDFSYLALFSQNFSLGPQLTYRTTKFEKSQIGAAAETSNSLENSTFSPGLAFWFAF